ncbi:hypothetical protein TWF696_003458 [Orbilia brochopaga]|uniref:Uncharacterized protein n=1 Tax=Orbilia brochopaga TaxID=3140254 RepID=A0AAV9U0U2_9PEZI
MPPFANVGPRHWLFSSYDRTTILDPFGPDDEDTEPDPPQVPSVVDNRPQRFRDIYEPLDAHNGHFGTIVIPRRHTDADLLVLLTTVDADAGLPPTLVARFLVSSHIMREHVPSFSEQFDFTSGISEAQRLGNRNNDIYAMFRWTLPPVDLDAAWIVMTILHGRWPLGWDILDLPYYTLFNIAQFVDNGRITPNSKAWQMIRKRLEYTLARHRMEIGRPTHPCVGQWLYIAKVFQWQEDFASLWANLIVSTWRFSMRSVQVDRYSEGFSEDPRPTAPGRWWYSVSDLGSDLMRRLRNDRQSLIMKLTELWAAFQRRYRASTSSSETIAASANYAGSPQDLRKIIIDYAHMIEKKLQKEALLANRQVDAPTHAGCAKLIRDVNAVFSYVEGMDVFGRPVNVSESTYWRPLRYQNQFIETPVELDPGHGSYKTLYTFQSGANDTLVYWRNRKAWRNNKQKLLAQDNAKRLWTFVGCTMALIVFFEYLVWYFELSPSEARDFRAVMYGLWCLGSAFNLLEVAKRFFGKVVRHTMHGRYYSYQFH